jgi:hypothetical protein
MLEKHGGLGRTSVAELTRTWASVPALLPRGGSAYWSTNGTFLTIEKPSPDVLEALRRDAPSSKVAAALLDRVADGAELTVDGALDLLRAMLPAYGTLLSSEYEISAPALPARRDDDRYLGNPLNAPLPRAKNLQIYCLYGYGKPTPAGLKLAWAAPRASSPANVPERYLEISKSGGGVVQGDGDGPRQCSFFALMARGGVEQRESVSPSHRHSAARVAWLSLCQRLGRLAAQPIKGACESEGVRARGRRPPRRVTAAARRSSWVGER